MITEYKVTEIFCAVDELKSEVWGEVLSEVFCQHLTLQIVFLQRYFKRKSEVLRSFCKKRQKSKDNSKNFVYSKINRIFAE